MSALSSYLDKILQRRALTHVLYWLAIVLIWSVPPAYGANNYEPLVNKLCYLPSQLIAAYLLLYYQIPRLVYRRRYLSFLISLLIVAYLTTVIARLMKVYVYETVLGAGLPKDPLSDILTQPGPLLGQYLPWVYLLPVITLIVKLIKAHLAERQKLERLQREKANAEINFLKAQLHPHFLFNTLNNLYVLTIRKSKQAPEVVKKLSGMLAYMFGPGSEASVPVVRETALLADYIDLELLRYGDRLDFRFDYVFDDPNAEVAPLVLLSMVENAFKHGASGDIGRPRIHIDLRVEQRRLYFRVFNTKPRRPPADRTDYKKGIGVSNIKRQLELIYPDRHQLDIKDGETTFEVELRLSLGQPLIPKLAKA